MSKNHLASAPQGVAQHASMQTRSAEPSDFAATLVGRDRPSHELNLPLLFWVVDRVGGACLTVLVFGWRGALGQLFASADTSSAVETTWNLSR